MAAAFGISTCGSDGVVGSDAGRLEETRSLQSGIDTGSDLEDRGVAPTLQDVGANPSRFVGGCSSRILTNISDGVDDPERIGNKLRAAREAAGLNQIELGEATGYSNGWISSVERGVAVPTGTFVRRMEVALGVDLGSAQYMGSRIKRGDVGTWGMTPTEVAGYVGLSRTRIYELLGAYSRLNEEMTADPGKRISRTELYKGYLPWCDVDGYRRVSITDCAKWRIYDAHGIDLEEVTSEELAPYVEQEKDKIKAWLKTRRQR